MVLYMDSIVNLEASVSLLYIVITHLHFLFWVKPSSLLESSVFTVMVVVLPSNLPSCVFVLFVGHEFGTAALLEALRGRRVKDLM